MWLFLWYFSALFVAGHAAPRLSDVDACIHNIREKMGKSKKDINRALAGIVGIGWDDLTSKPTKPIMSITYTECKTSPDGDFLIPDNIIAFPKKVINIQKSASTHESYESVSHSDSLAISGSAGGGAAGFSAKASFSTENQEAKSHFSKKNTKMMEQKIDYYAFDMMVTEAYGFDPMFTDRLLEVAEAVKNGDIILAAYYSEAMINDYGTHVVNRAKAGALVMARSFFQEEESKTTEESKQQHSASLEASFGGFFSMSAGTSVGSNNSQVTGSKSSDSSIVLITRGGPDINRLLPPEKAELKIDSLVGLNQEGVFIYSMIHKGILNNQYSDADTQMVQDLMYNATIQYYKHNTIPGCTDVNANNFNFRANVDDATCFIDADPSPSFGGIYQLCENLEASAEGFNNLPYGQRCEGRTADNHITKKQQCPKGFEPKNIDVVYLTFSDRTLPITTNYTCTYFEKLFGKCPDPVKVLTVTEKIKIQSFVCEGSSHTSSSNKDNEVLFAGIFEVDNVFSDAPGCPIGFTEYPFLYGLKICVAIAKDFTIKSSGENRLRKKAVTFGGIITCRSKVRECPKGFSKYVTATVEHCEVAYCARVDTPQEVISMPRLRRPPYIDRNIALRKLRYSFEETQNAKLAEVQKEFQDAQKKQKEKKL